MEYVSPIIYVILLHPLPDIEIIQDAKLNILASIRKTTKNAEDLADVFWVFN